MKSNKRFVYMLRDKTNGMYLRGVGTWGSIQEGRVFNKRGHLTQSFGDWKSQPERYEVVSFMLLEGGVYTGDFQDEIKHIPLLKEILESKI